MKKSKYLYISYCVNKTMNTEERIAIRQVGKPQKESMDSLVFWFCESLDLPSKEGIGPTMLKEIISSSIQGRGITSKELNRKLSAPRTTVIYNLNRLIYSGMVVRKGRKYYLREVDMTRTLEGLQADMDREFGRMIEFAEKIDAMIESDIYGRK